MCVSALAREVPLCVCMCFNFGKGSPLVCVCFSLGKGSPLVCVCFIFGKGSPLVCVCVSTLASEVKDVVTNFLLCVCVSALASEVKDAVAEPASVSPWNPQK